MGPLQIEIENKSNREAHTAVTFYEFMLALIELCIKVPSAPSRSQEAYENHHEAPESSSSLKTKTAQVYSKTIMQQLAIQTK